MALAGPSLWAPSGPRKAESSTPCAWRVSVPTHGRRIETSPSRRAMSSFCCVSVMGSPLLGGEIRGHTGVDQACQLLRRLRQWPAALDHQPIRVLSEQVGYRSLRKARTVPDLDTE